MTLETITAKDLAKLTKKELIQRVTEVETAPPANLAEQFAEAKQKIIDDVDGVELLVDKEAIAEVTADYTAQAWKDVNNALATLGKIADFNPQKIAMIDTNGRPIGRISNFCRELFENGLDDQMEIDRGKQCQFSPKEKSLAKDFTQLVRGILNFWQNTLPEVRTQWEEATRARGAKTESVKALSKITSTNVRTSIEVTKED